MRGDVSLERLNAALAYEDGELVDLPGDTQQIILDAARAYADLLANGVEPDYEAATREFAELTDIRVPHVARQATEQIVDLAIGDRLLINPPIEEE